MSSEVLSKGVRPFSIESVREEFPILQTEVEGQPLVYLDNAASSQKPAVVIDRLNRYYREENANIHRGIHHLSSVATGAYEAARMTVARFLNAREARQCIFTRGATESINLVAATWGRANIGSGDEILITEMEHHANIVPWQMLAQEKGARVVPAPINDAGEVLLDEFEKLLGSGRVKIAAFVHLSNALGTINPAEEMIALAHKHGVPVLLDAAQSAPHFAPDVQLLDCEWLVLSGHKVYGPTGIGVLYGKAELLEQSPPYQGGGDMIDHVSFDGTTFKGIPERYEAGTPHIAGAIGLGAALEYFMSFDTASLQRYDHELFAYAVEQMATVGGIRFVGTAARRAGAISFLMDSAHPQDIATILDSRGIAVRTGHHCAEPLMKRLGITGTVRASFAFYNTREEVDKLVAALNKVNLMFG